MLSSLQHPLPAGHPDMLYPACGRDLTFGRGRLPVGSMLAAGSGLAYLREIVLLPLITAYYGDFGFAYCIRPDEDGTPVYYGYFIGGAEYWSLPHNAELDWD